MARLGRSLPNRPTVLRNLAPPAVVGTPAVWRTGQPEAKWAAGPPEAKWETEAPESKWSTGLPEAG